MNKEEMNFDEVFSENDLEKLNDALKNNENIELPENLKKENIQSLLKAEMEKQEKIKVENEKIEKQSKKLYKRLIASAAAFAIVATSVFALKPWKYFNYEEEQITQDNTQNVAVEDYSKIENMFLGYAKEYQKLQKVDYYTNSLVGGFGAATDDAVAESFDVEGSVGTVNRAPSSVNATNSEVGSVNKGTGAVDTNKEHGETNEQVQGVNEADIIKNDGKYLYVVPKQQEFWSYLSYQRQQNLVETTGNVGFTSPGYNPNGEKEKELTESDFENKIFVVETLDDGSFKNFAVINIAKSTEEDIIYSTIKEIFVDKNRVIAILEGYSVYDDIEKDDSYYYKYDKRVTSAVAFDISDKNNIKEEWRVYQDGAYKSARKINDKVVLISNYGIPLYLDENIIRDYCVPEVACGGELKRIPASDICVMSEVMDSSYVVASTLNANDAIKTFNSTAVLGGGENVYCNTDSLYVTSSKYESDVKTENGNDPVTEIFMIDDAMLYNTEILKFDISGDKIAYKTKGKVEGTALNQFSIDEYNGFLRIATTKGMFQNASNLLTVLDSELKEVGKISNIAKGEMIKSVRFMGDTGYVVTFEQTDPLFVIDLSDPKKPNILGELKIPGFSNYLHPVTENLLLGIGVNGDENGAGNGMKVSLFDVSDKRNPKEVSKFEVEPKENTKTLWGYLTCEAFYDHKAVCWDSKNLTMYIPYSLTTEFMHTEDGSYRSEFNTNDNVVALKVNLGEKTLEKAKVYVADTSRDSYAFNVINRVTYTGDFVYAYSQSMNTLTSFEKSSGEKISSIELK